jgi:Raf kinase inhibitor-like YbhB/YbcL family protein
VSRRVIAVVAAALAGLAPGCGDETVEGPPPSAPATIRLTSGEFGEGDAIPARFTCAGEDVSPPLQWDGVPARARALALVMEDPDAPGGTFVHWTMLDLPPSGSGLESGERPPGAREAKNSFGDEGYAGPCPPKGDKPHRYVFSVYALDAPLGLDGGGSPADARRAIGRHAIATGRLTGRFGR